MILGDDHTGDSLGGESIDWDTIPPEDIPETGFIGMKPIWNDGHIRIPSFFTQIESVTEGSVLYFALAPEWFNRTQLVVAFATEREAIPRTWGGITTNRVRLNKGNAVVKIPGRFFEGYRGHETNLPSAPEWVVQKLTQNYGPVPEEAQLEPGRTYLILRDKRDTGYVYGLLTWEQLHQFDESTLEQVVTNDIQRLQLIDELTLEKIVPEYPYVLSLLQRFFSEAPGDTDQSTESQTIDETSHGRS